MNQTFGEIRKIVAPWAGRAGKCATADGVAMFAIQVMQDMLHSGSYAGEKKLCIQAYRGCISMPPEVETVIKVRIDKHVANLWNKWFSFGNADPSWGPEGKFPNGCQPPGNILIEDGTETPLAYELPPNGSILAVVGNCEEDSDASIIVSGKDTTGRPINSTDSSGEAVNGERFRIRKHNLRYGQIVFGEVTGVVKPKTNGYVSLLAYDPKTQSQTFLADWSPGELRPRYRRYRVISPECDCSQVVQLSMLCRVKLKDSYLDNDLTLFSNISAIQLAAQRIRSENNDNVQVAAAKQQNLDDRLEREASYAKAPGSLVSVFKPTSGASIRNVNNMNRRGW